MQSKAETAEAKGRVKGLSRALRAVLCSSGNLTPYLLVQQAAAERRAGAIALQHELRAQGQGACSGG
jgi:hypothetical protein